MRHICGIRLTAPGGKEICFAIEPDTRLKFVNSSLITPYGKVESNWKVADDKIIWHISAPANTRICVKIPNGYYCDNKAENLLCSSYDLALTPETKGK